MSVPMNRICYRLPALLLACALSSLHTDPADAQSWQEQIAVAALEELEQSRAPSLQIAVGHNGEVVFEGAYGLADVENNVPATSETKYRTASVTKWMTATAAGRSYRDIMATDVFDRVGTADIVDDDAWAIVPRRAAGYRLIGGEPLRRADMRDVSENLPAGGHLATALDLVSFALAFDTEQLVSAGHFEAGTPFGSPGFVSPGGIPVYPYNEAQRRGPSTFAELRRCDCRRS